VVVWKKKLVLQKFAERNFAERKFAEVTQDWLGLRKPSSVNTGKVSLS